MNFKTLSMKLYISVFCCILFLSVFGQEKTINIKDTSELNINKVILISSSISSATIGGYTTGGHHYAKLSSRSKIFYDLAMSQAKVWLPRMKAIDFEKMMMTKFYARKFSKNYVKEAEDKEQFKRIFLDYLDVKGVYTDKEQLFVHKLPYFNDKKSTIEFDLNNFARLIGKNSNTQVIIVKNEIELRKFLKKNLISNEIIIGMGAGLISKWILELKFSL